MGGPGRICEFCGLRERYSKNTFFASFPSNETRCKEWVRLCGKEDLVYLPIEKLRSHRACGNHFEKRDFNKKGNRLRRRALPKLRLIAAPLPNKMLVGFPLHVASKSESMKQSIMTNNDHFYSKKHHYDHCYALQEPVLMKNLNVAGQEANGNPELNSLLLQNNKSDVPDFGKSNVNEKTEIDFKKPAVSSKDSNQFAEGIPDFYDNDSSFQNSQGSALAQEPVFSWEKSVEVVSADDGDAEACLEEKEAPEDLPADISLYCDDDSRPGEADTDKAHSEFPDYQCNECREVIVGFRYTCVQCADFDLCAACEARAAHAAHYVLRVPGARPYSEIQAVLAAIRQQILSENLFLNAIEDRLKEEIKMEPDEVPPDPVNEPVPEADSLPEADPLPVEDPLSEQRLDSEDSSTESSEDNDSDVDSPPHRNETPEPTAQTDQSHFLTISSDDSDDGRSPRRKRPAGKPYEGETSRSLLLTNHSVPSNSETLTRDSIATTYRQLTKVSGSQLSQTRLTESSEENDGDVDSPPHRNETPEPIAQTDQSHFLTISSDDSDDGRSPRRKRQCFIPASKVYAGETVASRSLLLKKHSVPRNPETQTRDTIAKTYLQLTKVFASQLPQKTLVNNSANASGPPTEVLDDDPLTLRPGTIKSVYQKAQNKDCLEPVRVLPTLNQFYQNTQNKDCLEPVRVLPTLNKEKIEVPTEGIAHKKSSIFIPHTLRRSPRKRACEAPLRPAEQDPTMHRTDHQRQQTVEELDVPTENLPEKSEQLLNGQPEFILRLPAGTNEEALIQALQCPVAVRLWREF